jgi:hypothetical protein
MREAERLAITKEAMSNADANMIANAVARMALRTCSLMFTPSG